MQFVADNVKYFCGNLEKEVKMRRLETEDFRSRGLKILRDEFG